MMLSRSLVWLLAAAAVQAAKIAVSSPKVTISGKGAGVLQTETLSLTQKSESLTLGPTDTLKLTFQLTEGTPDGKGVQPHQTFLRFYDAASGEEGIQPVRVSSGGKAKFELNMAKPPPSLPPTSDAPLSVSLILGSFVHESAKYELFDLHVPASGTIAPHPDATQFAPQPEITHTFHAPQALPPRPVSAVGTALVFAPWVVLVGLMSRISIPLPNLFSTETLPFTILLGAFEGLLVWYWVGLRIGDVLLYGAVLAVPTVFAGNRALRATGRWRAGKR
ncbi:oligosaccharyl transferase delta subunit [Coniophora puteana RWD-64-598 SS2]|uniref:Ribophorin II n=1 Tax=Coniophora puteana (strain RWD-64-598) TaxID=741705 RepID=A0A5M3MHG4_CONPW|nr:oligosaccharyl transferase delta subunit [Coniophora puteana RWD-64-598 SS2]EIW78380.1 oligosaccharyl transferase delta subunit [Coniophora puteana RWD-64-598 SS2]